MGWDWVGTSNFMCTGARYTFFTTTLTKYFGGVFFIGCVYCMYACMYIYIYIYMVPACNPTPRPVMVMVPHPAPGMGGSLVWMYACMHACR